MLTADQLVSAGHALDVRDGDPARDAVDDVVPQIVIEPHTPEAVAASLAWASERRLAVLIEGGGTKRRWGRRPERLDVILSMRRLNRVLVHRHGDLTATVQAGMLLRDLNQSLASYGQQLPLDPPSGDEATVGGVLATNDSGPGRHRFGTPRDLVIGIQLATTDGRIANAGGQVVKNVAGYDLSKLVCGSFGTLAAILSATFKLLPLPASSSTVAIDAASPELLTNIVDDIAATQLEPLAFECAVGRSGANATRFAKCFLRFASVTEAVEAQVEEAARRLNAAGARFDVLRGDPETRLWQSYLRVATPETRESDAAVRVSWLPADLGRVLTLLEQVASDLDFELRGRAAVGAGLLRIGGDAGSQAMVIERLRQSTVIGNVVVARATKELKALIDVWGGRQNAPLLDAIKRAVDPNGTLGAGRA